MNKTTEATLSAILLTASFPAFADVFSVEVGAVVLSQTSLYEDANVRAHAFPLLLVERGRFRLHGTQAGYRVFESGNTSISLISEIGLEGYKSSDSEVLDGMRNRRPAVEAGAAITQRLPRGALELSLLHDISRAHDGFSARLKYEHALLSSDRGVTSAYVAGDYFSAKKGDYYFGVRTNEATMERPAYQQGEVSGLTIGINSMRRLNDRVSVIGHVGYRLMQRDLIDSPIVQRNDQFSGHLALVYRFKP